MTGHLEAYSGSKAIKAELKLAVQECKKAGNRVDLRELQRRLDNIGRHVDIVLTGLHAEVKAETPPKRQPAAPEPTENKPARRGPGRPRKTT
jgi:hypothetical protein